MEGTDFAGRSLTQCTEVFEQIPTLCKGHKVMLVYGGGSVKENGVYHRITGLLSKDDIPYVDYGGQTTASYQSILEGIDLVRKEKGLQITVIYLTLLFLLIPPPDRKQTVSVTLWSIRAEERNCLGHGQTIV